MRLFYPLLFFLLFPFPVFSQSKTLIDSLEKKLTLCVVDTEKVTIMCKLSQNYRYSKPLLAFQYGRKALMLAERVHFNRGMLIATQKIGILYKFSGNYDSAHFYLAKSLQLAQEMKDKLQIAFVLTNMGEVCRLEGNYSIALEYGLKALRIKEEIGDRRGIGKSLNNVGVVYYRQKDYQQALYYFEKALKIKEKNPDSIGLSISVLNIGEVYEQQGDLQKALNYYLRSLAIDQALGDDLAALMSFNSIAGVHLKLKNHKLALAHYERSMQLNRKINNKDELSISLIGMARIYLEMKVFTQSLDRANAGLAEARLIGAKLQVMEAYEVMHQVYAHLGQFSKAYEYRGLYMQMKDSLFNEENSKKITSLQSSYDLEKKQAEIVLLSKDRQLQQQEIGRQNLMLAAFGIGSVLVLVLAVVLLQANRQSRQKNNVLIEQKQQIESYVEEIQAQQQNLQQVLVQMEQQNHQLQDSEVELLKLNALKNKYFSILSHDLRNSFASLKAYLPLLRMHLGEVQNPEVPVLLNTFKDNIHHVNTLLDNVLLWSLSQMNMMPMEPKKLLLHELAQHNLRLIEPFALAHGIKLFNQTSGDQLVFVDENMLNSIFRNLLSNAIKFTPPGGLIGISSELKGQNVEIVVSDSGEGISEEDQHKLFNLRTNNSTTKAAKGTGLGLVLCREFVEKSGGSIRVESSKGEGTRFIFTLKTAEVPV